MVLGGLQPLGTGDPPPVLVSVCAMASVLAVTSEVPVVLGNQDGDGSLS